MRAQRDECRGDAHVLLLGNHLTYRFLVVKCLLATRLTAREQAIVTLGIKQALFIKAGLLETMVHIGGQDKVVFCLPSASKDSCTRALARRCSGL